MSLGGRECIHRWTPPGETAPLIEINLLDDEDSGGPVWPRFRILDVNHGYPVAGDTSHKRVGTAGAVSQPDYRGSRMHSYEIEVGGRNIAELRQGEQLLRDAFADQSAEGRMDVAPHEDSGLDPDTARFFNAKALVLDPAGDYVDTLSPHQGLRSVWTLGLRNHDGRYFEELTDAASATLTNTDTVYDFA